MVYSPHSLFSRASFHTTTNQYNSNTVLKGYPAGWAVYGDTAVGHSTMVEAWENWHNVYITPKNIIRVETRGPATLTKMNKDLPILTSKKTHDVNYLIRRLHTSTHPLPVLPYCNCGCLPFFSSCLIAVASKQTRAIPPG